MTDTATATDDRRRARVLRLLQFLHELIRAKSAVVRDYRDHEGVLWLDDKWGVKPSRNADNGDPLVTVTAADNPEAYAALAQIIDELGQRTEALEFVIATGLLEADGISEHLVSQVLVPRHDYTAEVIELRTATDTGPELHDSHLLTGLEGFDLTKSIELRTIIADASSPLSPEVTKALETWRKDVPAGDVTIADRPALVLRRRDGAALLDYFEHMIAALRDESQPVPIGLAQLVESVDKDERVARLAESGALSAEELVSDALYPLPSNVEQRDILSQLGVDSGVVVEGPPGTGKTHTIANLLAALLAKGQRVLVVSEKAQALRVLKEKLPPQQRELVVSLTEVGSDGAAELAASVTAIANRKGSFQPRIATSEIKNLRSKREQARAKREQILRDIWQLRESETEHHDWVATGYSGTAAEIVRKINDNEEQYSWLAGPVEGALPPLTSEEFTRLVDLTRGRAAEGADRLAQNLPDIEPILPDPLATEQICKRISDAPDEKLVGNGSLLAVLKDVDSRRLLRIKDRCEKLNAAVDEVRSYPEPIQELAERLLGGEATYLWERVTDLASLFDDSVARDKAIGTHTIEVPDASADTRNAYAAAATYVADGGAWRAGRFRKSAQQKAIDAIASPATVDGAVASTGEQFQAVADHLTVLDNIAKSKAILSDVDVELDTSGSRSAQVNRVVRLDRQLSWISDLLTGRDGLVRDLQAISPGGPRPKSLEEVADVARQAGAIAAANDGQLARAELNRIFREISDIVEKGPSPEGDALLEALRNADAPAIADARRRWRNARSERDNQGASDLLELRLRQQAPALQRVLGESAADAAWDERTRSLEAAWAWRYAKQWAEARSKPGQEAELESDLDSIDADIAGYTAQLAAACAWRECLEAMTVEQVQALQSYRDHVTKIGKGSGRHAERFRKAAREAMTQARSAVPAWVMPISQVLSSIEPQPNSFDVVIVDEASQADITSLFLLWLAPQVIVVGDDRQCAPGTFATMALDDVFAKLDTYLPDVPQYLRDSLTPRSSLFSMLRTRFGHVVRLREHFRSMPEIIEYSSQQFYPEEPLVPVRQFGGDRLEPLVSVSVKGVTKGSGAALINIPEAEALVEKVIECHNDPRYDGLTFGVVVLQGQRQVDLINQLLRDKLDARSWHERRMRVGTPPDFQGDERHVTFLSMVVAPDVATNPLQRSESQRRFNVAASRAMDQMWLFHSMELDDLKPNDLRYSLLSYVESFEGAALPQMPSDVSDTERREPFESVFEQRIFNELARRGYHVTPKVTVNNRVVDLVVTGRQANLAVECSGDEFTTTPEQARADLERERELRRCDWRFARVRESEYLLDREQALAALWEALEARGVEPVSFDTAGSTAEEWLPIELPPAD